MILPEKSCMELQWEEIRSTLDTLELLEQKSRIWIFIVWKIEMIWFELVLFIFSFLFLTSYRKYCFTGTRTSNVK